MSRITCNFVAVLAVTAAGTAKWFEHGLRCDRRPQVAGVERLSETEFVIRLDRLPPTLSNVDEVYSKLRILPAVAGGRTWGVCLAVIAPDSLDSRLGFIDG